MVASPRKAFQAKCTVSGGYAKTPKLAGREIGPTQRKTKTLIETRNEGGLAIVAPSAGGVHPTAVRQKIDRLSLLELYGSSTTIPTMPEPTSGIIGRHGRQCVFKSFLQSLAGSWSDTAQDRFHFGKSLFNW